MVAESFLHFCSSNTEIHDEIIFANFIMVNSYNKFEFISYNYTHMKSTSVHIQPSHC